MTVVELEVDLSDSIGGHLHERLGALIDGDLVGHVRQREGPVFPDPSQRESSPLVEDGGERPIDIGLV